MRPSMLGTVQGCGSSEQRKHVCCVCSWLWLSYITIECELSFNPGVGRFFCRCWWKCTGRTDFRQVKGTDICCINGSAEGNALCREREGFPRFLFFLWAV